VCFYQWPRGHFSAATQGLPAGVALPPTVRYTKHPHVALGPVVSDRPHQWAVVWLWLVGVASDASQAIHLATLAADASAVASPPSAAMRAYFQAPRNAVHA